MLWFTLSAAALAHVGLEDPPPRYPSDGLSANKSCPCGLGANNGICSVADARSDPDRAEDRVTVYTAGDTITMQFYETIGHSGRWRVAFDPDGADMDDFNANILVDEPDPPGSDGNVGQGNLWEFEVTLPTTPCDTCTLQLVQVMDGDTVNPVPDPTGRSSYYQCADITLISGDSGDTGTVPSTTDTATPGTTDPTGSTPTDPTGSTPTGPTGSTPTDGDPADPDPDLDVEKSGCGCESSTAPILPAAWGSWLRRRR